MPRDAFSDSNLTKVRTLAGYLLLTEDKLDKNGSNYKEYMQQIANILKLGTFPKFRDTLLEKKYFIFSNIDEHYKQTGRMFRHLMSLADFFGFMKSVTKQNKIVDYHKCREYYLSNNDVLLPIARNNLMILEAGNNNFMKSLNGIEITSNTQYRPTYAILRYMESIRRAVTKFELSILLGRLDNYKKENDILERALKIGSILPQDQNSQISFFFNNMNWINENNILFSYASSQQPQHKFNNYLLFMQDFQLIKWSKTTETYTLTDYSLKLLSDDVSFMIADLEKLISAVEDYDGNSNELNDLILYQRNPELLRMAKEDKLFIQKMNLRSINKPQFDKITKKKKRNRLISELAKIQVDYKCQYEDKHMFRMESGKYYCEAHHILEFSTEDGPDITNNLVVLGPFAHTAIHHARQDEVDDIYFTLVKKNAITYKQLEEMVTIYKCLTLEQIDILKNRKIITSSETTALKELVTNNHNL